MAKACTTKKIIDSCSIKAINKIVCRKSLYLSLHFSLFPPASPLDLHYSAATRSRISVVQNANEKKKKIRPLKVATPLDPNLLNGLHLGLHGDHQYLNGGLAIALCSTWLQKTGHIEFNYLEQASSLPDQFIEGLTKATLQGRAQVVPDQFIKIEKQGDLVFYLDGAYSPESMEVCAKWFSLAIKEDKEC